MSRCTRCNGKGYIESTHLRSLKEYPKTSMCPDCKDVKAYSQHIKDRYGNQDETQQQKVDRLTGIDDDFEYDDC